MATRGLPRGFVKRKSIFLIRENGREVCLETSAFHGLEGALKRLLQNAGASLAERLSRRACAVPRARWDEIVSDLSSQDAILSAVEIDEDGNALWADEELWEERAFHEYALRKLLDGRRNTSSTTVR